MKYTQFENEGINHRKVSSGWYGDKNQDDNGVSANQSQVINLNPLDVLVEDESEHKFFTSRRIYLIKCIFRKILIVIFNTGPIYFSYAFVSIYMHRLLRSLDGDKAAKAQYQKLYNIYHRRFIYDYILNLCVCSLFLLLLYGFFHMHDSEDTMREYIHWSVNAVLFIFIYTVFITQKELDKLQDIELEKAQTIVQDGKDKTQKYVFTFQWSFLISQQNYYSMGLGRSHHDFIKNQDISSNDQITHHVIHFQKQIEHIIEQQNLDPTLIYFAMRSDFLDVANEGGRAPQRRQSRKLKSHQVVVQKTVLQYLADLGFSGKRSIFQHFMIPHYVYTRKYTIPLTSLQTIIIVFVVLVKIVYPTFTIMWPIQLKDAFYSIIFTGFYLHFIAIIFDLVLNDDLKTQNYIYLALNKLMNINEITNTDSKLIDITCALSLQCWDLMRKVTLYIERSKKIEYNYIYGFLALYGACCFGAFLLCRFDLPFMEYINYCGDQILLYQIHADLVLCVIICMGRIYQGDQFNQTFDVIIENVHRITAVYEDLYTLFDYYFIEQATDMIQNDIYREIIHLIKLYGVKQLKTPDKRRASKADVMESEIQIVMRDKVSEIRNTMLKIQKSVERDQKNCQEKFIGHFDASVKKQFKIVLLVLITFVPGVFDKMGNRLAKRRHTVKPLFSGTTDVIVIEREDGSIYSTDFNLRIGKLKTISPTKALIPSNELQYDEETAGEANTNFSDVKLVVNGEECIQVRLLLNLYNGVVYFARDLTQELENLNQEQIIEAPLLKKTLQLSKKPTSNELKSMKLRMGKNEILYEVQCQKRGLQQIKCEAYLVKYNSRIFISDVDGTVTKSDVMGMFMQSIGKNYTHEDICELYTKISNNSYTLCYMSARSCMQYAATKEYLQRQKQGQYSLPDGPLLVSSDAIFEAFKVEVVYKTSDLLKIQLLSQIKDPIIYGGVGNRLKDVVAYTSAGVQESRIYLIDKKSVIIRGSDKQLFTYRTMADRVNELFPVH